MRNARKKKDFHRSLWYEHRADDEVVDALWRDGDALIESGTTLKDGDRCTVVRLDTADRPLLLKRYNLRGPLHTGVHTVMRSRAAWSLLNAHRVLEAGLTTPQPLACLESRSGPLRTRSYLLTEYVHGPTLLDHVRKQPPQEKLHTLATQFARIWQTLGRLRLGHGDMKASNFLLRQTPNSKQSESDLVLIDLDGMRRFTLNPLFYRQRNQDRERFMRNWKEYPQAGQVFRNALEDSEAISSGVNRGRAR